MRILATGKYLFVKCAKIKTSKKIIRRCVFGVRPGVYATTAVLPGESRAAFEKLHRDLIAEFEPSGVLEDNIVADMARSGANKILRRCALQSLLRAVGCKLGKSER